MPAPESPPPRALNAPASSPRDTRSRAWAVTMPALRWDGEGYRSHGSAPDAHTCVDAGCSGFILFGGTARAAADLIAELRARAARPLLFGADLERGTGQQFAGATTIPPLGALGVLDDLDITREAGRLTGREARALGVDILFAPVADLAVEPDNPIVGPRAFGAEASLVARHVAAWVEGAASAGALACVKHFPGHGRTTGDTHLEEVRVDADGTTLEADLLPFRAAVAAGVPLVMPGHLAAPALDPSGRIATVSPTLVSELLRRGLGFGGVVVTDALLMGGAGPLARTVVDALSAGVDLLLYPEDPAVAVDAIERACVADSAFRARLDEAAARVAGLAEDVAASATDAPATDAPAADVARPEDESLVAGWARAAVRRVRGERRPPGPGTAVRLLEVDDDVGGPWPVPARAPFREALGSLGPVEPSAVRTVIAVWGDTRGWKGRAGLSDEASAALAGALADAPDADVVVFGGPRVVSDIPEGPTVWLAWGGEARMQRAAAAVLRAPSEDDA
jgi:beta-glucosidase